MVYRRVKIKNNEMFYFCLSYLNESISDGTVATRETTFRNGIT